MSEDAKVKILEETRKKANEIIEEARRIAESIIKEAEENWLKKAESEKNKILREANARASVIIAEAKSASRFIISKAKLEVVENVYEKIYEIIKEGKYNVEYSLKNLLKEALGYVEKPVKIIVRKDQVDIARKVLGELGIIDVEIEGSDNIMGGLILISKEGVVVDNRLETRIKQSRDRLLNVVAKVLLGES